MSMKQNGITGVMVLIKQQPFCGKGKQMKRILQIDNALRLVPYYKVNHCEEAFVGIRM